MKLNAIICASSKNSNLKFQNNENGKIKIDSSMNFHVHKHTI